MKYFIIHAGVDFDQVKIVVQKLMDSIPTATFCMLSSSNEMWKKSAEQEIKSSNKIILFISSNIEDTINLEYELNHAYKENKDVYIYKLDKKCKLNKGMANILRCTTDLKGRENTFLKIDTLANRIKQDLIAEKLCNTSYVSLEYLEQYKLFVKTSEDLVKRKQTTNNLYITLNLAILSIIIAIAGLDSEIASVLIRLPFLTLTTKPVACMVVAVFGILICLSWTMILKNYAHLNSGKMALIIRMEKRLPLNLFDTEWQYVILKSKRGKYTAFSNSEQLRAYLFLAFYVLIILGCVLLICRQYM